MTDTLVKLEECVANCLLCKLSKPSHGKEYHTEYQGRTTTLKHYFPTLIQILENIDFRQQLEICSETLHFLLILYLELKTEGPWNTAIAVEDYSSKLNHVFEIKYGIALENILLQDNFYCAQEVFDKAIKELHQRMTSDDFKKCPGLIEVYILLIKNIHEYNITLYPLTVLPVALLLVDDYIVFNKVKGLKCCACILKCLGSNAFVSGNYYEVLYRSLKNNIHEKDIEATQSLFKCFLDFLKIIPSEVKKSKLDDVFSSVIEQLSTESNLYRKAVCFDFITKVIEMHGIHCVKKKIFKDIICDNLDMCSNEGVYEILIQEVLECLVMWLRHCWCIWKLPADHRILSLLIKTLYVTKDEGISSKIQNLILTLIHISTKEEQKQIYYNLQAVPNSIKLNGDFCDRINIIKESINA